MSTNQPEVMGKNNDDGHCLLSTINMPVIDLSILHASTYLILTTTR